MLVLFLMYLSLVIPAYNEGQKILVDLEAARSFLEQQSYLSEVIVVDDGSSDRTAEIVQNYIQTTSHSRVLFRIESYGGNRGKGYAVKHGILSAQGEIIAFADAGLCVPLSYLKVGIQSIHKGFDYALASRRLHQTVIKRSQPTYRVWGSRAFSLVIRTWMGVNFVSDTQCGFKVYTQKAAQKIFGNLKTTGFMFDIEALLRAKDNGLKGTEFAVEWSNDSDSRYDPIWGTLKNYKELKAIKQFRNEWLKECPN